MAHRPNQPAIPFIRLWARERPVSMPQRTRNRTRRFPEVDSPRDYRWCQSDAALSPRSSRRTVFCHFDARSITALSGADTTTASIEQSTDTFEGATYAPKLVQDQDILTSSSTPVLLHPLRVKPAELTSHARGAQRWRSTMPSHVLDRFTHTHMRAHTYTHEPDWRLD